VPEQWQLAIVYSAPACVTSYDVLSACISSADDQTVTQTGSGVTAVAAGRSPLG